MINERALLSALKEEWKGAGYTVGRTGEELLLKGIGWTLRCTMEVLPRKVLALLVEHLGEIPGGGDCWNVSKKSGSQTAILQVADTEFQEAMGAQGNKAAPTRLTFGGWRVWQEEESLRVLLMNEDLTSIVVLPKDSEARATGRGIVKDAGPDVLQVAAEAEPPEAEYLESVQWK